MLAWIRKPKKIKVNDEGECASFCASLAGDPSIYPLTKCATTNGMELNDSYCSSLAPKPPKKGKKL